MKLEVQLWHIPPDFHILHSAQLLKKRKMPLEIIRRENNQTFISPWREVHGKSLQKRNVEEIQTKCIKMFEVGSVKFKRV